MFLRQHIDPSLRWEYLQLKTPKELWDALKGRFGNIHDSLLPELMAQWTDIRLLDYKKVNDFNKEMLRLKARLNFCGKELSEHDMIEKTLSTFPTSSIILMNQYRMEYDSKRITTFNKLINLLQVAERHNEVLLNNNARPVGTKKIPESNHASVRGGKNSKVQRGKHIESYTHGNYTPQGHGRGQGRGHGRGQGRGVGRGLGRGNRRGGFSNSWHRDATAGPSNQTQSKGKAPAKRERDGTEPCYRCGITGHWYKHCGASNAVAANYKRYRESKEQETHYLEETSNEPEVNLTIGDFTQINNNDPSLEASDFV